MLDCLRSMASHFGLNRFSYFLKDIVDFVHQTLFLTYVVNLEYIGLKESVQFCLEKYIEQDRRRPHSQKKKKTTTYIPLSVIRSSVIKG